MSPGEGRHKIARAWSRASGGTPGNMQNKYEPRRGGIMLCIELRRYMYFAPYLSHALCHPSTGVPVCLSVSPGFRRVSGYTAGLPYIAPRRGSDFGGHSSAGYPLQIAIWRVFRGSQIDSCGANTIGVLDFSPTFIIKACHQ